MPSTQCIDASSPDVRWRGEEVDTIFGFEKEADALQWIKELSEFTFIEI
jgi:hypothetical protein